MNATNDMTRPELRGTTTGRDMLMRCVRPLALVVAALAILGSTSLPDPVAASTSTPPSAYFGMHYLPVGYGDSWPDAPIGFVRLWDTGTKWKDIQPTRDRWDWTVLDAAVANARAHHAKVSLVLGQTPAWASARPTEGGAFYGHGAAAPPTFIADWWIYAHAVAARYRNRIESYEIWNEVNLRGFYSGSVAQMARLVRVGRDAIKSADRSATVVAPSVTLRSGTSYLRAMAKAGAYRYSDVVNLHGYPPPTIGPEGGVAMVDRARAEISPYPGGRKPVWITEINFGLRTPASGGTPTHLTSRRQAAFVVRAYLLNWTHGVRRLAWYDWSAATYQGVRLSAGGPSAAPAGKAFRTVRRWMRGQLDPCTIGPHGVYRCRIRYSAHHWGSVRWAPSGTRHTALPQGAFVRRDVYGHSTPIRQKGRVRIGESPVLLEFRR